LGTSLENQIKKISGLTDAVLFNITLYDAMPALQLQRFNREKCSGSINPPTWLLGHKEILKLQKLSIQINHYETDGPPYTITSHEQSHDLKLNITAAENLTLE